MRRDTVTFSAADGAKLRNGPRVLGKLPRVQHLDACRVITIEGGRRPAPPSAGELNHKPR